MPNPFNNPKSDRSRFEELMSRTPGSRLSEDELTVFENEINRRREQARSQDLFEQYKREVAVQQSATQQSTPRSAAMTMSSERTRQQREEEQRRMQELLYDRIVKRGGTSKTEKDDARDSGLLYNRPGEVQIPRGLTRADKAIGGGIQTSAAQTVNLGGTALEGLAHLNDAAYDKQTRQQVAALQNSLEYWQSQLKKATTEAERQRAQELADRAERNLRSIEEQKQAQTADAMKAAGKMYESADRLQAEAQENVEAAKEGLGGVGRLLVDAGVAGTQMMGDAVANAIVPGSGLAAMGARVFGGGTQQVRQAGGSYGQQLGYGAASAAVEVATEKMFGVFENIYGKGWLDNTGLVKGAKDAIAKLNISPAGRTAIALLGNAGEEATEEIVSGILSPLIDSIYNGKSVGQNYSEMELGDVMHDALVGGVLGLFGGNSQVMANAEETASYKDVYGRDSAALVQEALDIDPENKTAQAAQKRLEEGKELPARMLRRMVEENEARIAERAPEAGETAPAETTAEMEEIRRPAVETEESPAQAEQQGDVTERVSPEEVFLRERAEEFGAGAEDFLEYREAWQDPDAYYTGFQTAFRYGQANGTGGVQIDEGTRQDLRDATGLTDEQIDLAYSLGRAEVSRQEGAVRNGTAEENGLRVRDGGQRLDSQDPRGQAGTVAKGAGADQGGQAQGGAADRGAAAFTYAREGRSTAQLIGASKGSTTDQLRIVTGGYSADVRQAVQLAQERGITPHLFAGGNLRLDKMGRAVEARGYIQGKAVFLRADDSHFTASQIMRHEIGHDMIAEGEVNEKEVRERLREKFTEEQLDNVTSLYAELYEGSGMTAEEIWEEIICDSLGDMNVFEGTRTAQDAPVAAVLAEAKAEATWQAESNRGPPNGQKNTAPREGGKMSISPTFKAEFDLWIKEKSPDERRLDGGYFRVGTTSEALKAIGVKDTSLFWRKQKIGYLMADHPEMTADIVKQVPDIIENPVAVLKSATVESSIVVFGELKADNGDDVMAAIELTPRRGGNSVVEFSLITSAYSRSKGNLQNLLTKSEILYLDANKKRTDTWLMSLGVQFPSDQPAYGSMGSIRYEGEKVNISGKKFLEKISSTGSEGSTSLSTDSLEGLRQENEELRGKVKEFEKALREREKQLQATRESRDNWRNKATFRPESVAREIIRAYEGTIREAEIHDEVKALIDTAAKKTGVSFEQLQELAMPAAKKVVESARAAANGEEARTWEAIKQYHRESKIRLTTEVLAEFRDDPGFQYDFRRDYARPLNLTSGRDGVDIDVAYAELGERFGKAYYPDSITHPADQLRRMAEVRESLAPVMENPYSLNMALATEHCANELVDRVMGEVARGYQATYAGRLEEQLYQVRKSAREAIARERQRSEEQVKALKDHWREQQRQQMERRSESEDRDRLLKIARRLENKKLPAAQRSLIQQYIGELDTVSRALTGRTLGDLTWLEHWYNEQKADPDFIPDAATEGRIHRLYQKHVDDMDRSDVLELTRVLQNIENEIRTKNQFIESREKRDVFEAGIALMQNLENAPGSKASGVKAAWDRFIVTETLSPLRQVRRMVGYVENDPMVMATNALADGQRTMFDYQRRALERFRPFVEDKEFTREITGKHAREIEIRGIGKDGPTTVKITPSMRISLYLHSKNPQNLQHIAGGGVRVPDMKIYKQGKLAEAYARGTVIKLKPSEVQAIVGQMTARERQFADIAYDYFNTTSKESINEVSEKLKGYSIAGVEDYFPIHTDDSFTRKDFESIKFDGSIEGMGFLKERIKSSSPIYLRDLNSVLTQAIDMHAKYVGLAIPVRNFNKLWGVTAHNVTEDGDLGASGSVQSMVRQQWGEDGRRYIEKMMSDLQQGGREQSVYARELAKVRSHYAGAVLTLNASVAMKQAASYPTAAAVVGWKPLIAAMKNLGRVDLDLIAAYTPLQWYRSRGFSTQELGDMAKRGKQLLPALNWVQGADLLTTRKLWKAAEIYVRDNFKTLERGSAEEIRTGKSPFYQKVAEVYNRIIEETQPNYTTMQRPQLLRSDDTLLQNLQMFKTQPFQNFNILYDALGNLAAKERAWKNAQTEESRSALREAKRNAAWAVSSQAVQLLVFAGMTALWNAFRGKPDKYKDEDGDVNLLSIMKGVGLDMVSGLFSVVPFGGDVWALGSSVATGGKYYGVSDVTTSALTDAGKAVIKAGKTISELLQAAFDDEKAVDLNAARLKLDSVVDAVSKAMGLPYENVLNLGKAVFRQGTKALEGDYMGQYRYLQLTTDPNGTYKADYYDLLWQAYKKDRNAHRELYRQMVADGWDPDKIKSAMETRMKKD